MRQSSSWSVFASVCSLLSLPIAAQPGTPLRPQTPTASVLRVFLLAGQSNMEGHAVVDLDDARDYNGGRGNLARFVAEPGNAEAFGYLRAADGAWAVRDDVFVAYRNEHGTQKHGALTIGFAVYDDRHHFGPELGIGHVLGQRFTEPVLLIKTAWGGKSLAEDFRPPSAGGKVGPFYTRMLAEYRAALGAIAEHFPPLAGHTPRLDGFVWFQGWNDGCSDPMAAEYEANLVHLIGDLRREFASPTLPIVVGETGNIDNDVLRAAQRNACLRPAVRNGTLFVPTGHFRRAAEASPNTSHGHHWFGNAESYLRIGDAMGRAIADLVAANEAAAKR